MTYLLIANRELALCLLVRIRKGLQFLDRLRLRYRKAELDVSFGVLMSRLYTVSLIPVMVGSCNIHKPLCHLEEQPASRSTPYAFQAQYPRKTGRILDSKQISKRPRIGQLAKHAANEKRIARKNGLVIPVLHEVANAILRVARGVQGRHGDAVSNLEDLPVGWGSRNRLAIFAANDGDFEGLEHLVVAT